MIQTVKNIYRTKNQGRNILGFCLGEIVMDTLIKYHIVYEDEHGPHTCIIEEAKLNIILRRLIQANCYICDITKL